jgi:two-component system response regulator AtoC
MSRILVLDDEENIRFFFTEALRKEGYEVRTVGRGDRAIELFGSEDFDVAVVDLKLPDIDGMEVLKNFRRKHPHTPVIMITAHGTRQVAHQALREGAYDYFTKPFDLEEMRVVIRRAVEKAELVREVERLRQQMEAESRQDVPTLVGESPAVQAVRETIATVAESDVTCLILGESGTGKELAAELIHRLSRRRRGPFIKLNCAAIPDTLIESEMLGFEKGAFTGAQERTIGKFEQADGGTLLLDEIGDMAPLTQTKLLRVIETGEFHRVGGTASVRVNVRLIAATNQDLKALIAENRFREDLYYRVNVVSLSMPPLREHPEDIPILARIFLKRFNEKFDKAIFGISEEVMERFLAYGWPGNVRELQNVLQRAVVLERGEIIGSAAIPESFRGPAAQTGGISLDLLQEESLSQAIKRVVGRYERALIQEALERSGGNKTRAAKLLKISRVNLHQKVNLYGLETGGSREQGERNGVKES